jgi:hypothetical protein
VKQFTHFAPTVLGPAEDEEGSSRGTGRAGL